MAKIDAIIVKLAVMTEDEIRAIMRDEMERARVRYSVSYLVADMSPDIVSVVTSAQRREPR